VKQRVIATIAVALTAAAWTHAWVAAELVLGGLGIDLMMKGVAKAAQQTGRGGAPFGVSGAR
jgi:hypothetical protein